MNRYDSLRKVSILLVFALIFSLIGANMSFAANATKKIRLVPADRLTDEASCLPCHGSKKFAEDPNRSSLYIRKDYMKNSLHKNASCLDCHTDLIEFARIVLSVDKKLLLDESNLDKSIRLSTDLGFSHSAVGAKVYMTANLSCRNCKEHRQQGRDYFASVHAFKTISDNLPKTPMCSTCHGSHYINDSFKKDRAFRARVRSRAKSLCGKCHQKYFESYNDSYHGMPYKSGSQKAPVCWDCHSAHMVRAVKDPESLVYKNNIVKTCGRCHKGCDAVFIGYSSMIHNRQRLLSENPVVQLKDKVAKWYYENIAAKIKKKYIYPLQSFLTSKYEEYLRGRDKAVEVPTRMD